MRETWIGALLEVLRVARSRPGTPEFPVVVPHSAVAAHPAKTHGAPFGDKGSGGLHDRLLHNGSTGAGCQKCATRPLYVPGVLVRSGSQGSRRAEMAVGQQAETQALQEQECGPHQYKLTLDVSRELRCAAHPCKLELTVRLQMLVVPPLGALLHG